MIGLVPANLENAAVQRAIKKDHALSCAEGLTRRALDLIERGGERDALVRAYGNLLIAAGHVRDHVTETCPGAPLRDAEADAVAGGYGYRLMRALNGGARRKSPRNEV